MRRGHDQGTVDEARPGPVAGEADGAGPDEPPVVVLRTDDGRSWEDLLSEAVEGPASGPAHEDEVAAEDDTPEPAVIDLRDDATADQGHDVTEPSPFGELVSEVVLPGGRRVARYRLPRG